MTNQIPTATLLVGYCRQEGQQHIAFANLAEKLSTHLEQPVVACPLDEPGRTVRHAITDLLQQGMAKIVTLPLFLSPAEYRDNTIADAVTFASGHWPTAVILVGQGTGNPDINSDLTKLSRLLYEDYAFGWVDVAFVDHTTPAISELLARYQTLGAKQIIIVPTLLFEGNAYHQLLSQVKAFRGQESGARNKPRLSNS